MTKSYVAVHINGCMCYLLDETFDVISNDAKFSWKSKRRLIDCSELVISTEGLNIVKSRYGISGADAEIEAVVLNTTRIMSLSSSG